MTGPYGTILVRWPAGGSASLGVPPRAASTEHPVQLTHPSGHRSWRSRQLLLRCSTSCVPAVVRDRTPRSIRRPLPHRSCKSHTRSVVDATSCCLPHASEGRVVFCLIMNAAEGRRSEWQEGQDVPTGPKGHDALPGRGHRATRPEGSPMPAWGRSAWKEKHYRPSRWLDRFGR